MANNNQLDIIFLREYRDFTSQGPALAATLLHGHLVDRHKKGDFDIDDLSTSGEEGLRIAKQLAQNAVVISHELGAMAGFVANCLEHGLMQIPRPEPSSSG